MYVFCAYVCVYVRLCVNKHKLVCGINISHYWTRHNVRQVTMQRNDSEDKCKHNNWWQQQTCTYPHTHTHTFARIISTYLHIKDNCCTNTLGRGYKESLQSQQVHTQRQRRMKGALVYNNNKHNRDAWLYFYNYHLRYSGIFFDFTIPAGSFRALKLLFRMNIHFQFCYYFDRSTFYV